MSAPTHTITQTVGFQAQPKHLYEALTEAKYISVYTQSPAVVDAKEGGTFTLFGGSIQGKFVKLDPPNKIVELWRFQEWPDDVYSTVEITLTAPNSKTCQLTLKQTGIPDVDKYGNHSIHEKVKNGWENFFWSRIQQILGYHKVDLNEDDD